MTEQSSQPVQPKQSIVNTPLPSSPAPAGSSSNPITGSYVDKSGNVVNYAIGGDINKINSPSNVSTLQSNQQPYKVTTGSGQTVIRTLTGSGYTDVNPQTGETTRINAPELGLGSEQVQEGQVQNIKVPQGMISIQPTGETSLLTKQSSIALQTQPQQQTIVKALAGEQLQTPVPQRIQTTTSGFKGFQPFNPVDTNEAILGRGLGLPAQTATFKQLGIKTSDYFKGKIDVAGVSLGGNTFTQDFTRTYKIFGLGAISAEAIVGGAALVGGNIPALEELAYRGTQLPVIKQALQIGSTVTASLGTPVVIESLAKQPLFNPPSKAGELSTINVGGAVERAELIGLTAAGEYAGARIASAGLRVETQNAIADAQAIAAAQKANPQYKLLIPKQLEYQLTTSKGLQDVRVTREYEYPIVIGQAQKEYIESLPEKPLDLQLTTPELGKNAVRFTITGQGLSEGIGELPTVTEAPNFYKISEYPTGTSRLAVFQTTPTTQGLSFKIGFQEPTEFLKNVAAVRSPAELERDTRILTELLNEPQATRQVNFQNTPFQEAPKPIQPITEPTYEDLLGKPSETIKAISESQQVFKPTGARIIEDLSVYGDVRPIITTEPSTNTQLGLGFQPLVTVPKTTTQPLPPIKIVSPLQDLGRTPLKEINQGLVTPIKQGQGEQVIPKPKVPQQVNPQYRNIINVPDIQTPIRVPDLGKTVTTTELTRITQPEPTPPQTNPITGLPTPESPSSLFGRLTPLSGSGGGSASPLGNFLGGKSPRVRVRKTKPSINVDTLSKLLSEARFGKATAPSLKTRSQLFKRSPATGRVQTLEELTSPKQRFKQLSKVGKGLKVKFKGGRKKRGFF